MQNNLENEQQVIDFPDQEMDTAHIAELITIINSYQKRIAELKRHKADAMAFCDTRTAIALRNISFLQGRIDGYLTFNEIKTISTYRGTAFKTTRTKTTWPADDVVLQWINTVVPEADRAGLLNEQTVPRKDALTKWLKDHAPDEPIPGLVTEEITSISIRKGDALDTETTEEQPQAAGVPAELVPAVA